MTFSHIHSITCVLNAISGSCQNHSCSTCDPVCNHRPNFSRPSFSAHFQAPRGIERKRGRKGERGRCVGRSVGIRQTRKCREMAGETWEEVSLSCRSSVRHEGEGTVLPIPCNLHAIALKSDLILNLKILHPIYGWNESHFHSAKCKGK